MPTRVYTFGLPLGPTQECAAQVEEQYRQARIYQNQLIEHELTRRAVFREIVGEDNDVSSIDHQIKDLKEEIDSIEATAKKTNQKARKRIEDPEARQRLKELKSQRKQLQNKKKVATNLVKNDPVIAPKVQALDERAKIWKRGLREQTGCYWGTYLLVEKAHVQRCGYRTDPEFKPWDGSGRIGVQIQDGLPVVEAFNGSNTYLRLDHGPRKRFTRRHPKGKVVRNGGWAHLRIGTEGNKPVWATFPAVFHRSLPQNGVIKWAWVYREKIGDRFQWKLQLTVVQPSVQIYNPGGTCAINVGWRVRSDGLRAGYLVDEYGSYQEILLPQHVPSALEHVRELQSVVDKNFNVLKDNLKEWMSTQSNVPPWLRQEWKKLAHSRSTKKFARLLSKWEANRFPGDDGMFTLLYNWRRQDKHLYQWLSNERHKARLRRRHIYRNIAADLTKRYSKILLGNFSLSALGRRPEPLEGETLSDAIRRNKNTVSCGIFQDILKSAASKNGCVVEKVSAKDITITCYACGTSCNFNRIKKLSHSCEHCGTRWDQDENAARNMLQNELSSQEAAE